ncbi:MAG: hypothetical protein P8Y82_10695, partial [Methyloceanibacter sp.]
AQQHLSKRLMTPRIRRECPETARPSVAFAVAKKSSKRGEWQEGPEAVWKQARVAGLFDLWFRTRVSPIDPSDLY